MKPSRPKQMSSTHSYITHPRMSMLAKSRLEECKRKKEYMKMQVFENKRENEREREKEREREGEATRVGSLSSSQIIGNLSTTTSYFEPTASLRD